jgi:uncharacterized RmlC-like cupin family protein
MKKVTCQVISAVTHYHGKQGLDYGAVISAQTVGSSGLCMHFITIPPGGKAKAHFHDNHETAIYVLKGHAAMWYGKNLEEHLEVRAGDFLYIPAGVPHLPYNASQVESAVAVLARTDPNEQESVVLTPELDYLHD